jgi:hypothetical protein
LFIPIFIVTPTWVNLFDKAFTQFDGRSFNLDIKLPCFHCTLDQFQCGYQVSHSGNLNSTESLEEGVVLLATREDDGSFAVRRVVQNKSVINSALATFASVGAEHEKARQLQEEQDAVDQQRAAARAALKAA